MTLVLLALVPARVMAAESEAETGEGPTRTLLVTDLAAEVGVEDGVVRLLTDLLLSGLSAADHLEVRAQADVAAMLGVEAQKALMGCGDGDCIVELAGALGSDLVLVWNVGRIGEGYLMNVKVLDGTNGLAVTRISRRIDGDEGALVGVVEEMVAEVLPARKERTARLCASATPLTDTVSFTSESRKSASEFPISLAVAGGTLFFPSISRW